MSPVPEEEEHDAKPHDTEAIDDLPLPDVFINVDSSDSEADDNEQDFNGYQMLPQDIDEDGSGSAEELPSEEINASQIDEAIRNSGVHVQAGGGSPSYMQVLY